MSTEAVRKLGAVYTPSAVADWVAAEVLALLPSRAAPVVLDPACGDGALLAAVRRVAPRARLRGLDIDPPAVARCGRRLGPAARVAVGDFLLGAHPEAGGSAGLPGPELDEVDALVANPPWGAHVHADTSALARLGYSLATGQYDSYELFVERALTALRAGTPFGFIIPDSLFLPEHAALRRLLVRRARLVLVARLGEGLFEGVCRGTVVVVGRTGAAPLGADPVSVRCFRLTPLLRRRLLAGETDLRTACAESAHVVPQSQFAGGAITVDLAGSEASTWRRIDGVDRIWDRRLVAGRGVEMSRAGRVVQCARCQTWRPHPLRGRELVQCGRCRSRFDVNDAPRQAMIRCGPPTDPTGDWAPLIVGEDVDRHRVAPSRAIRLGLCGIRYKPAALHARRKLLVRKTGVGLKACVHDDGAYTLQAVYHFFPADPTAPDALLDYVQGVLCSRVLLAWHLCTSGETEWRSFPYVTPTVIRRLPVPDVWPGHALWPQAEAIARAVRIGDDLRVERLVAGMFGLDRDAGQWVLGVLTRAQPLEPIRTLWVDDPGALAPILVCARG